MCNENSISNKTKDPKRGLNERGVHFMDQQDYLYKYAWCYVQLNQQGERPVEKHLLSFLGPEPGGKPRPPRLSLFQLGLLRSARLSGRVREESQLRIQVEPPPRRSGKSGGNPQPDLDAPEAPPPKLTSWRKPEAEVLVG